MLLPFVLSKVPGGDSVEANVELSRMVVVTENVLAAFWLTEKIQSVCDAAEEGAVPVRVTLVPEALPLINDGADPRARLATVWSQANFCVTVDRP